MKNVKVINACKILRGLVSSLELEGQQYRHSHVLLRIPQGKHSISVCKCLERLFLCGQVVERCSFTLRANKISFKLPVS